MPAVVFGIRVSLLFRVHCTTKEQAVLCAFVIHVSLESMKQEPRNHLSFLRLTYPHMPHSYTRTWGMWNTCLTCLPETGMRAPAVAAILMFAAAAVP